MGFVDLHPVIPLPCQRLSFSALVQHDLLGKQPRERSFRLEWWHGDLHLALIRNEQHGTADARLRPAEKYSRHCPHCPGGNGRVGATFGRLTSKTGIPHGRPALVIFPSRIGTRIQKKADDFIIVSLNGTAQDGRTIVDDVYVGAIEN